MVGSSWRGLAVRQKLVGLGRTRAKLAWIYTVLGEVGRVIVVGMASLVYEWPGQDR